MPMQQDSREMEARRNLILETRILEEGLIKKGRKTCQRFNVMVVINMANTKENLLN